MMIKKVYRAEICVFMARLRGVTSGSSSLGDFFPHFQPFSSNSAFHFISFNRSKESEVDLKKRECAVRRTLSNQRQQNRVDNVASLGGGSDEGGGA